MVKKDETIYYYDLKSENEVIPLQMGSGKYTVALNGKISGNKYMVKASQTVDISLADEKIPFLQSATLVKWDKHSETVKLAEKLTKGLLQTKSLLKKKGYAMILPR